MTRRRLDFAGLFALLGLAGCGARGKPASATAANAAAPAAAAGPRGPAIDSEADLEKAIARENTNLTPTKVANGDWKLEGRATSGPRATRPASSGSSRPDASWARRWTRTAGWGTPR